MLAKEIIDSLIQPVKPSDNCLQVLSWMEEYKVLHLPVVNQGIFIGVIAESDIYALEDPDVSVEQIADKLLQGYVSENTYVTDVLSHFTTENMTLYPVLTDQKEYVGSITLTSLTKAIGKLQSVDQPGAVIVIELNQADYVLSQIAQIAESNDVRLLAVNTHQHEASVVMDLILKTNTEEVDSFIKTLERYDYHVKMAMTKEDPAQEKLNEHYQYIMTYLGI